MFCFVTCFTGKGQFDLIITCPPYYNLEVYRYLSALLCAKLVYVLCSDLEEDLSACVSYEQFRSGYREIIGHSARLLRDNRYEWSVGRGFFC